MSYNTSQSRLTKGDFENVQPLKAVAQDAGKLMQEMLFIPLSLVTSLYMVKFDFFVMDTPAAVVKPRPVSLILVKWVKLISRSWRKTAQSDRQIFMQ